MTNDFEDRLNQALGRVPTPNGLEQKIMAKVNVAPSKKYKPWYAFVAGFILAVSFSGYLVNHHYRAERAKTQLLFALQLTSEKLSHALEIALNETQERVNSALEEKKP
ncbi:MAG: hypothetical protein FWG12_01525 [Holophagaceae bacterium]|nr:hypothetical protein [Holophagaceae bacterium]